MNFCRFCREHLSEFLDGTLPPAEQAQVAAHLETCADCAREKRELEAMRATLRDFKPVAAPAELRSRVRAALREESAPKRAATPWLAWKPGKMVWAGGMTFAAIALMILAHPYSQVAPKLPATASPDSAASIDRSDEALVTPIPTPLVLPTLNPATKSKQFSNRWPEANTGASGGAQTSSPALNAPAEETHSKIPTRKTPSVHIAPPRPVFAQPAPRSAPPRSAPPRSSAPKPAAASKPVERIPGSSFSQEKLAKKSMKSGAVTGAAPPVTAPSVSPPAMIVPPLPRAAAPGKVGRSTPEPSPLSPSRGGSKDHQMAGTNSFALGARAAVATEGAARFNISISSLAPRVLKSFARRTERTRRAERNGATAGSTALDEAPVVSMAPGALAAPGPDDAMTAKALPQVGAPRFRGAPSNDQLGALEARSSPDTAVPQTPALTVPAPAIASNGAAAPMAAPTLESHGFHLSVASPSDVADARIRVELPASIRFAAQDASHAQTVWQGHFEAGKSVEIDVSLVGFKGGEKITVILEQIEVGKQSKVLDTQTIALPSP